MAASAVAPMSSKHWRWVHGIGTQRQCFEDIRSGADVFKALALGADAVLVGRLQLYALAVAGALGVAHMLQLLRDELEICMAQAGCATLADIHGDCVLPLTTAFQSRKAVVNGSTQSDRK